MFEKGLLENNGVYTVGTFEAIMGGAHTLQAQADARAAFIRDMDAQIIAPSPDKPNEQHYELPAEFFAGVLGAQRKYSCGYWPEGVNDLDRAEEAALHITGERAGLADGMDILELGCGWGSLYITLLRVSGVVLLEKDIVERRPAYRDYIDRTNAFFPGIPRDNHKTVTQP